MQRTFCWLLLAIEALSVGCRRDVAEYSEIDSSIVLGPQYSAKKGLLVPNDTRQSLGLTIVEATEQKVPAFADLELRIYKSEAGRGFAAGRIAPEQAALVRAGQDVQVQAGERAVPGRVAEVNEALRRATGWVEIVVEIPEATLEVGAFAQARIATDAVEDALTVPRSALLECSDGYSVYTVSGEHYVRTPVIVGTAGSDLVEIKEGLYAGDQVVEKPVMALWMTELAAVKSGQACCVMPAKGK